MKSFVHFGYRNNRDRPHCTCGGVLIAWDKVLTAAHCDVRPGDYVFIGTSYAMDTRAEGVALRAEGVENHPNYSRDSIYHDLAIVTLTGPSRWLLQRNGIKPVLLDFNSSEWNQWSGVSLRIMGFGGTHARYHANTPHRQQVGDALISRRDVCEMRLGVPLDPSMCHCFNGELGGASVCKGDSGSPVVYRHNGEWVLVGIAVVVIREPTDAPTTQCIPGAKWVAINIENYGEWIARNVGP